MALAAAVLFGAATPASKMLLGSLAPFQLAGLLYLGAALGVAPAAWRRGAGIRLPGREDRRNRWRLLGAIVAGGILGPIFLLLGLRLAAASSVSLWLNLEVAATALLGVLFFRDHLGLPGWAGVACALGASALLSAFGGAAGWTAGGLILAACVCWGLDNHLTALIDGITPAESTFWKGLIAGTTNLTIGLALDPITELYPVLAALAIGVWSYGFSIVLYIAGAQAIGATRAQVVFASAPFFGVALSILVLGDSLGPAHVASGLLFVTAIGLLALEQHGHVHEHGAIEHEHAHRHDDGHHDHDHDENDAVGHDRDSSNSVRHTHRHRHRALVHAHPHWPDLHHRHPHPPGDREGAQPRP